MACTCLPAWEYRLIVVPNADCTWATVPVTVDVLVVCGDAAYNSLLSRSHFVTAATEAAVGSYVLWYWAVEMKCR